MVALSSLQDPLGVIFTGLLAHLYIVFFFIALQCLGSCEFTVCGAPYMCQVLVLSYSDTSFVQHYIYVFLITFGEGAHGTRVTQSLLQNLYLLSFMLNNPLHCTLHTHFSRSLLCDKLEFLHSALIRHNRKYFILHRMPTCCQDLHKNYSCTTYG